VEHEEDNGADGIRAEVQKIARSARFVKAERLNHFLRLVVEETLSGRGDQIKEYVIGTEVYSRPVDYDPRTDATVRVEASKLRKRLSEYYSAEGRDDTVVIRIPKGCYRPEFEHRAITEEVRTVSPPRLRPRRLAFAIVLVAGVAGLGAWFAAPRKQSLYLSKQHLVSTHPGSHHSASFSPDGSAIVYIDNGSGPEGASTPQVWIKDLSSDRPIQIAFGGVEAAGPAWSARGTQITFERKREGIWVVPRQGGEARQIVEDGRLANVSLDGSRLVFIRRREIWTARADGREQVRVEGVPERFLPMQNRPALSPDGRWVAFFNSEFGPFGDIWVIAASGGVPKRLTFDQSEARGLVWSPDGRWIIFSSARRGSLTLWRVLSTGGKPESLTTGAGEDYEPAISSDGTKLIYTNTRTSWSLMTLDPASGMQRELMTQRELIGFPSFSPDGKRIAFFQPIHGSNHLFAVAADGGAPEQITKGESQHNIFPAWSRDGLALYYYQVRPALSFRRQDLASGGSTEVAAWAYEKQNWAQVDPSGRIGAYTLVGPKGPLSTLLRDLDTGRERRLPLVLTRLQWSRDGDWIVGESGNRDTGKTLIATCHIAEDKCSEIALGLTPKWSADGRRIYFLRPAEQLGWFHLWSAYRDGSAPQRISTLGPFRSDGINFDVSWDGTIVWAPVHTGRQELWLADVD
jgi:Tol biopolymer transport system component